MNKNRNAVSRMKRVGNVKFPYDYNRVQFGENAFATFTGQPTVELTEAVKSMVELAKNKL